MREQILSDLQQAARKLASQKGLEVSEEALAQLHLETPPKPEMGDLACPVFSLAKVFRSSPVQIAQQLTELLRAQGHQLEQDGSYLNFRLPRAASFAKTITEIAQKGSSYGDCESHKGEKIMIEFSSPNTNKPLHLGHLRNDILGEAVSRILAKAGADVHKVNLINDRGVHICKSMLAYQKFGKGASPESTGIKGDHFVGDYYVKYNQWEKGFDANGKEPSPEQQVQAMLEAWEAGDEEVHKLWGLMRDWTLNGIKESYERTHISFDRLYFESQTYKLGKEIVQQGLESGVFQKREDGAVVIDLSEYKLDSKVVQRSNGTTVYITQDLGTAAARHQDYPFDRLIYVVGSEQDYHFKVLFQILKLLGFEWTGKLQHLSYGMVTLPEGKMKSREGTVVDADKLLDQLEAMALEEIESRERESLLQDPRQTAHDVAIAALNHYLLGFTPQREISFNPKESLSFTGNTGPYLQYIGARIHSILGKAGTSTQMSSAELAAIPAEDWAQLSSEQEWELLKQLQAYAPALEQAAIELNPAHLVKALNDIGRSFSRFYHDVPILQSPEPLLNLRLQLCKATLQVIANGMEALVLPLLSSM